MSIRKKKYIYILKDNCKIILHYWSSQQSTCRVAQTNRAIFYKDQSMTLSISLTIFE